MAAIDVGAKNYSGVTAETVARALDQISALLGWADDHGPLGKVIAPGVNCRKTG